MKKTVSILLTVIMIVSFVVPTILADAVAATTLNVTSKSGVRGDTLSITINISSGSNMQACGFELKYDKNVLEVIDVTKGTAISANPVVNKGTLGKVKFSYAATSPVTSAGSLINVMFKIKSNSPYGKSDLNLVLTEMSDGSFNKINATANSGSVTVIAPPLEAPTGFLVDYKSRDCLSVFWNAVDGATGYNLYLNGEKINEVPIVENTYIIDNLIQNTQYQLAISSINYTTESQKSETLTVKTEIGKYLAYFVDWRYNGTITDGGEEFVIDFSEVEHGGIATPPVVPPREGYTFIGWDKPLTNITDFTVIQAQYAVSSNKVTFINYDGTKLDEQLVEYNKSAIPPTPPARTGYTFLSWSESINNITAPITVTAQYMPNKYNIAYNANGGTGTIANSSHTYDEEIALSVNTFLKAGAGFDSWNTKADGTGIKYTNAQIIKNLSNINGATITLYAIWNVNSHTVTFKGMDGNIISTVNNVANNTSVIAPDAPTIPGYTFTGWDKPLTNIIADTIITAVYTKINETAAQIIVSNEKGSAGKTVVVSISLKNNPGITGAKIKVGYDSTKLKLISAVDNKLLNDGLFGNDINANPYALCWDEMTTVNNTKNGAIVMLTFMVANDCVAGKTDITITCNPSDIYDADLNNVSFATQNGSVDIVKYISGDVNDDGEVNSKDAAILRRYVAEWTGITINELAADVNRDGEVNSKDAAILRRYVAEWTGIVLK